MRQFSNGKSAPDSLPPEAPTFSWPHKLGPWLLGMLVLSGGIVAVTSFSEIKGFVQLLLQHGRHLVTDVEKGRNALLNTDARSARSGQAVFRTGYAQRRDERNGLFCRGPKPPWSPRPALYGRAIDQPRVILHVLPSGRDTELGAVAVLSRNQPLDCDCHRSVLRGGGGNSGRGLVATLLESALTSVIVGANTGAEQAVGRDRRRADLPLARRHTVFPDDAFSGVHIPAGRGHSVGHVTRHRAACLVSIGFSQLHRRFNGGCARSDTAGAGYLRGDLYRHVESPRSSS